MEAPDKNLALDLSRVTEAAALASARWLSVMGIPKMWSFGVTSYPVISAIFRHISCEGELVPYSHLVTVEPMTPNCRAMSIVRSPSRSAHCIRCMTSSLVSIGATIQRSDRERKSLPSVASCVVIGACKDQDERACS